MSEEDALLRAICEQPDEDTPRLVFADWLTEQGGPVNAAWANAIRAQIWLARGATDAALARHPKVFESSYGRDKIYERIGLPQWVLEWARGFPTCVRAHFHELRDAWPRLAFRVPIRSLYVYEASEAHAAEFVGWPALAVLNELGFNGSWNATPPPDVLSRLANCPALCGIKALTVRDALYSEDIVTALLDSPHFAGLEVLRLDIDPTTPALSQVTKSRLLTRFGPEVFTGSIPF